MGLLRPLAAVGVASATVLCCEAFVRTGQGVAVGPTRATATSGSCTRIRHRWSATGTSAPVSHTPSPRTLQMKLMGDTEERGGLASWAAAGRQWATGVLLGAVLLTGVGLASPAASWATTAEEGKEIAVCLLKNCKAELAQCILNPKCFANLICLQTCNTAKDETTCQIKCGDLFENEAVGKFNACAVSQKKCVKQRQDGGEYPIPPAASVVKQFDPKMMEGRWYITAGLNPVFDTFDCQVHFFVSTGPGQIYGKLNWRIQEPDGEFFTRNTVQKFKQDADNPGLMLNHDNEYLHYQDDWYILDAEPNSHVLVYYRGRNDAWDGYGGAVLYTQTPTVPAEIVPRVSEALERANLHWKDFVQTDNSCKPLDPAESWGKRAGYATRLFLTEGEALSEQLTRLRGVAGQELKMEEEEALKAIRSLEELTEQYESGLTFSAVQLEDTIGQELAELVTGVKKEVEQVEEVAEEVVEEIKTNIWGVLESKELKKLESQLEKLEASPAK